MNAKNFYNLKKLLILTGLITFFSLSWMFVKQFNLGSLGNEFIYGITFFLSGFFLFLIIGYFSKERLFTDLIEKSHAIHTNVTPRIGGLGIFLSIFIVSLLFFYHQKEILFFIAASTIVFIIGLFEDYTQELPPILRLIMLSIPVMYILVVLNGIVYDLYYVQLYFPIALIFTIFAVIGFINAINIIDGLNGLSSGIALIGFLFIYAAAQNSTIENLSALFFFATLAFFIINITTGKIFLGDGGSYLLGFSLGELAVLLSNEPYASAWYPFALLIYPVWEVLFSILRRKKQGKGIMQADKLHLHTLLYYRVFRYLVKNPVKANSLASLSILSVIFVFDLFVYLERDNTYILTAYTLAFILSYIFVYKSILHFKLGKLFLKHKKKTYVKTMGEMES